jgi:hypothetical protein
VSDEPIPAAPPTLPSSRNLPTEIEQLRADVDALTAQVAILMSERGAP